MKIVEKIKRFPFLGYALSGVVAALGFAPLNWWICFILGWNGFYFLYKDRTQWFKDGLVFGFFYALTAFYWIGISAHAFDYPLVVKLLIDIVFALGFSIFIATASWVSKFLSKKLWFVPLWLSLALSVGIIEYIRGVIFTGFPWNNPVSILPLSSLQIVRYLSSDLISIFVMLGCFCFWSKRLFIILSLWTLLLVNDIWGRIVMQKTLTYASSQNNCIIRLVQPNIPQKEKWDKRYYERNFDIHLKLSCLAPKISCQFPRVIVWSESATGHLVLNKRPDIVSRIRMCVPKDGYIITGAICFENNQLFNSIYVISKNGIEVIYHKYHLAPFGEYVPLRKFNPFPKMTDGTIDYTEGPGPQTIHLKNCPPFIPLVCYEIIFSKSLKAGSDVYGAFEQESSIKHFDQSKKPSGFILNVTNDGWFKTSNGPYQHLKIAQMRAIEAQKPVVRCAYSGISAVIDTCGRIIESIPLGQKGILDSVLPS